MSFTVYDGIFEYATRANKALYLGCRTAIFNNPGNVKYTPKGKSVLVREVDAGKPGNYNKSKGWLADYGTGGGIKWVEYTARYDRAKVLAVDSQDELQSYQTGADSSIGALAEDFIDNHLAAEVDAANIASFFHAIPEANKFESTATGFKTGVSDDVYATLINLKTKVFNAGYKNDIVVFIRADVYATLQKNIIDKFGLANGVIVNKEVTVILDSGLGDKVKAEDEGQIEVTLEVQKLDNLLLIPMPDDRMYSKIVMYDGISAGQTAGGYVKDETAKLIDVMAIPLPAAFTNMRYLIANFLVPASAFDTTQDSVDLMDINKKMFGNVEIGQAGINQKADKFEYDIRAIFGGDIFSNRAKTCFAITQATV